MHPKKTDKQPNPKNKWVQDPTGCHVFAPTLHTAAFQGARPLLSPCSQTPSGHQDSVGSLRVAHLCVFSLRKEKAWALRGPTCEEFRKRDCLV